ncbi:MAG: hypothetical protein OQJ84_00220, partial [Xanthomonadales bacterium]|nr:hypothetical protein [Xanthomonadales bacterium]
MFTKHSLPKTGLLLFALYVTSATGAGDIPDGPYLGQQPPGSDPVLFAPGIVSDELANRDLAMLPDGSEVYFSANSRNFDLSTILVSYRGTHGWSEPRVAPFAKDKRFKYLEPAISPDGAKFFFVATERDQNNNDIWVMDRSGGQWGKARKLGEHINTDASETFPSITDNGTLYFSRASENPRIEHIYRSRLL